MKKMFRLVTLLGFAFGVFSAPLSACFDIEKLSDGNVVVTDCWGKSPCITWTADRATVARWIANAVLDGERFC